MIPRLGSAGYVSGHAIRFRFADGTDGVVDPEDELWGEVFETLQAPETFRSFKLDVELNTMIWPPGADLASEFLYEQVAAQQADETDRPSAVP